jgi:4-amino-4-deoxy-L-arabinose transferase-like glycosyltransferase
VFGPSAGWKQILLRRGVPALLVASFAWLLWHECGSAPIRSWREADTQTIALHLAEPGASIFYPRIAWGGAGPGYVEAEFQLYTWLVAQVLRVFGECEWPGKLVSLLATLGAAGVVFAGLTRRHGDVAASFGVVVLLSSRGVAYAATSVQPEALCFLFYVSAWFAWLEFESSGRSRPLVLYGVLGALAMLVKPTAAQIGIASGLLLALRSRRELGRARVWLAWFAMVFALSLHLWHARNVYLEYGNTFGVLSGGDSKIPQLRHLLSPRILFSTLKKAVLWGTSPSGAAAIVAALLFWRRAELVVALLVANVVWTLLALRYTSGDAGNHYHLMAALTAAHAAAAVIERVSELRWRRAALVGLGVLALGGLVKTARFRAATVLNAFDEPAAAAALALASSSQRGDLVVVRSVESAYDREWGTVNNFEDPRVFYLTRTRGWALGLDDADPRSIAKRAAEGARFYVETIGRPPAPGLDRWLEEHAVLVRTTSFGGKVFDLRRRAPRN